MGRMIKHDHRSPAGYERRYADSVRTHEVRCRSFDAGTRCAALAAHGRLYCPRHALCPRAADGSLLPEE